MLYEPMLNLFKTLIFLLTLSNSKVAPAATETLTQNYRLVHLHLCMIFHLYLCCHQVKCYLVS